MKKHIVMLLLFAAMITGWSQSDPTQRPIRTDLLRIDTLTTAQKNLIPTDNGRLQLVYDSTLDRLEQRKPGGTWEALAGGGTAYTATSPISLTGNAFGLNMAAFDWTGILTQYPAVANLSGTNTGDQNLSPYFRHDGTVEATGDWDLGGINVQDWNSLIPLGTTSFIGTSSVPVFRIWQKKLAIMRDDLATEDWILTVNEANNSLRFEHGNFIGVNPSIQSFYTLNQTGTPTNGTDLIDLDYFNANSGGGATTLDGLTDVVITTPQNNQVLGFNGTNWVNTFTNTAANTTSYNNATSGLTATNVQTAIDELAASAASGLSAEQANRLSNTDKIDSYIKTANFNWSPLDVHNTSGTTDNGKKSIVANETGTTIEGVMEDADMTEGQVIRVRCIGAASQIVSYFAQGAAGLFRTLSGATGNQWTATGAAQFVGTKEGNVITVDGGTVSTRTFTLPNVITSLNAATTDVNSTAGWTNPVGATNAMSLTSVASTDTTLGDGFAIQLQQNVAGVVAWSEISHPATIGVTYSATIRWRTNAATALNTRALNFQGISGTVNQIPPTSWGSSTFTYVASAATVTHRYYVGSGSGIGAGEWLQISSLIVTAI